MKLYRNSSFTKLTIIPEGGGPEYLREVEAAKALLTKLENFGAIAERQDEDELIATTSRAKFIKGIISMIRATTRPIGKVSRREVCVWRTKVLFAAARAVKEWQAYNPEKGAYRQGTEDGGYLALLAALKAI